MSQCLSRVPHGAHPVEWDNAGCLGRPAADTPLGQAWAIIEDAVTNGLDGDASGIDDGVAVALEKLGAAGLLVTHAEKTSPQTPPDPVEQWLTTRRDQHLDPQGCPETHGRTGSWSLLDELIEQYREQFAGRNLP